MPFHSDNLCARQTLAVSAVMLSLCTLVRPACAREPSAEATKPAEISWNDISADDVAGKGWRDTKAPFDRLPARAEKLVRPPVWDLSRHSAGLYVDFSTNATAISARWTLTSDRLAMPHMTATGVSGVDLYVQRDGKWHYLASGRATVFPTNEAELVSGLPPTLSKYRLYFPLYNGVSAVAVGVPRGSRFEIDRHAIDQTKPVVIYGTSITQGGCASRPGMSFAAILGRRLNVPVINLGFSGNGKAEREVATLLGELDASAFVIDPLPNLFAEQVGERLPAFIGALREARPDTPILLNESPRYPTVEFVADQMRRVTESNQVLQEIGKRLKASGDRHITVIPSADLSAGAGEGTVDGIHPTDVGFVIMADAIEPALRKAIE